MRREGGAVSPATPAGYALGMSPVFDLAAFFAEYEEAMHAGDAARSRRLYADTFVASSPAGVIAGRNDDEFAQMVLFLAADDSGGCTAQQFMVDGGRF